ncbi:MAG: sulfatase [Planctomycetaceae bacterium]|nr:sulfatase [Planctomycetaceae bacterium]
MPLINTVVRTAGLCLALLSVVAPAVANERPNVIFIICDDLNDYVEGYGGHPDAITPHMARLARSGVRFTQAHCAIPICGPSRAALFTGVSPHHSGCYGFTKWDTYPVLKNSRTLMDHFRANGYRTLGTGKLMHHMVRQEWQQFGNRADYGPFAFANGEKVAHPDVPAPFRDIGAIDGSFGPFVNLSNRTTPDGQSVRWQNGGWGNFAQPLRVDSQSDRDQTPDERNGDWAVENIRRLADGTSQQPFFLSVGFIRPHTPLIVPQRFFDLFPLEDIDLPVIRPHDVDDTFASSVRGLPNGREPESPRSEDMGTRLFRALVTSYPTREEGLRRFIQAYLASVASVDEQIGRILDTVDATPLADNTIVILTSDHGWGMGEKDYLYKNSLWQESTQVPLIIRAPGMATNADCDTPVSLIDLYPTLIDLCELTGETKKNAQGHALDGHSLKPLLADPASGTWTGPNEALTALYKWRMSYVPAAESYSLRAKSWRYIRYENGKEELYDTTEDPHEWTNLAGQPEHQQQLTELRQRLLSRLPKADAIPPQPAWQPNKTKPDAEQWKDAYFRKHPEADTNGDGKLTWSEYKTYRAQFDPPPTKNQ